MPTHRGQFGSNCDETAINATRTPKQKSVDLFKTAQVAGASSSGDTQRTWLRKRQISRTNDDIRAHRVVSARAVMREKRVNLMLTRLALSRLPPRSLACNVVRNSPANLDARRSAPFRLRRKELVGAPAPILATASLANTSRVIAAIGLRCP